MWDWFINFLVWVIESFASIFGDYGIAIIVMTIIFRICLLPLTIRQMRSMARMQVLQPKLQEIQTRYEDDPQRMQEEMMKFQRENHYNPLGGCLPMLLQWPIFFALFGALNTISQTHPDASFLNIMPSIAISAAQAVAKFGIAGAWVYILFDLFFGLGTVIPTLMSSSTQSPEMQRQSRTTAIVMGIMMVWMGWNVAGGVLLYYDTSSLIGILQQQFITRKITEKAKEEEAARLAAAPVKVDVERREKAKRPRKKS